MKKLKAGIYLIECEDKKYIGRSKDVNRRWSCHRKQLREKVHPNDYMQKTWNKYGEEKFSITIIEYIEDENERAIREDFWIKEMNTLSPHGMNLKSAGEVIVYSKESREKMSQSKMGNNHFLSEESRKRASDRMKGNSLNLGQKSSDETKKKMSNSMKGRGILFPMKQKEKHQSE